MKPRSGSASLAETNWFTLIDAGVVVQRLGRGLERLDRAGQIGQGFGNGNQLAALTLHGFILPCTSDKTGAPMPSAAFEKQSMGRAVVAGGFLGTALYHQERLFAEWFQWREMR